jgi:subtilase family serine protease
MENHNMWALEVSLDVEWAHAIAPEANILLVTTPTAETLGVQGFSQMMNAVQYVVDNHLADVISMSLGAGEGTFSGAASLMQLRQSLFDAQANHVTVLASSGDGGTSNRLKQPVRNPQLIPYPSVGWPASDPLVTAVGGTYLCSFQNALPAGSSYVGSSVGAPGANSNMRGVPDVALQASARTGTLV